MGEAAPSFVVTVDRSPTPGTITALLRVSMVKGCSSTSDGALQLLVLVTRDRNGFLRMLRAILDERRTAGGVDGVAIGMSSYAKARKVSASIADVGIDWRCRLGEFG